MRIREHTIKKDLLHLLCLAALFFLGRAALLYLIEPADYSLYFNRTLKNKAEANNNRIDMVILGTSRPHRTFSPAVLEEELGLGSVFNASSGLQPLEASYYMLKEISGRYRPRYAVLDITSMTFFSKSNTLEKVIVLDRLHGINKLEYLLKGFSPDEYLNAISLCYRFRNNFTAEKIKEIVQEKQMLKENGYTERRAGEDLYTDSGFIYSYRTGDIENAFPGRYDFKKILPGRIKTLENIIRFCEENGIRLFFVTTPTSMMNLFQTENYQDFTDYFTDFAAAHNIPYVNLNYLRDREEWLGDDMMYDAGHVNGAGADLVSARYAQVLRAVLENREIPDIFYENAEETKSTADRILALRADISITDLTARIRLSSCQTADIEPLFRISLSTDEQNYIPLTGWTDKTEFEFDMSEYRGTAHFLIEAMSPAGQPGTEITYHIPI